MLSRFSVLKSGIKAPAIFFGTDGFSSVEVAVPAIRHAISLGYGIDGATGYPGSHEAIAQAMASQDRESIFLTTKFHGGNMAEMGSLRAVVGSMLKDTRTDYIDQVLIHNPAVESFPAVFHELIDLKREGIIKSIGVSNFTIKHLRMLGDDIKEVDVNQIEMHPYLIQDELQAFCKAYDIRIMAYRPLCPRSDLLRNEVLSKIAVAHNKTTAQIALCWLVGQGMTPVVKATSIERIAENAAIFDFALDEDEMTAISKLNRGLRTCTGPWARFDELVAEQEEIATSVAASTSVDHTA